MGVKIKIRRCIIPVKLVEKLTTSFAIIMIPTYYYFNFFVVLPDICSRGSTTYWINLLAGNFIALNIIGNYVCMLFYDTSARAYKRQDDKKEENHRKEYSRCELCDKSYYVLPPRTWHCIFCNTCILKRDHHCMFIGYCIGQYNRRFFIIFLLYMVSGTTWYFYFTTQFLRKRINIFIPKLLIQILCPPSIILLHPDSALHTMYLILYVILIIFTIMVCLLCIFNAYLIVRGIVGIEIKIGRKNSRESTVIENIKEVLGVRWYLTWICPLISSDLPLEIFPS